jgi:hypothetical protein
MRLLALFFCNLLLSAELLDRVAVTVGTRVITESELLEEIRLDSFLNGQKPQFDLKSKREAADRLIEQKLIRKEMESGSYPSPSLEEADTMIENLRKTRAHDNQAEFGPLLSAAGITLDELKSHLVWGLTLSHFIDVRFRPAVQVSNRDIARYFEQKVLPNSKGPTKPDLDSMRAQIEQTIAAERSDQQLDAWLKDTRAHTAIVYRNEVFGPGQIP